MATSDATGPGRFVRVELPEESDWRLAFDAAGTRLAVALAYANTSFTTAPCTSVRR
jgi:hypothetical protein